MFGVLFYFIFFLMVLGLGCVESLDPNVEIVVPEDDHGLYALDILDPSLVSLVCWFPFALKK